ncbi:MAG: DUF1830 domain-containing protein [Phormidesmis sp. RL_2_1]|nr:DUF1830 domain-containing protein [Phormidesmis sp. RL_2_1]
MAQILDPLPADDPDTILCCYINATSKIQIARVTNVPDWYFERVVFPGQRLMFEAVESAMLEIHTGMMASAILSDTIPCTRLMVELEGDSARTETSSRSHGDVPEATGRTTALSTPSAALTAIAD